MQNKPFKLLTLKRGLSAFALLLILCFSSCVKESARTIHGVWNLQKYSCDEFSNYRKLTFFFDTLSTKSDSAWYIDPSIQKDTVVVKYSLNGSKLQIIDATNGWNGTYPFKFTSATTIEITRGGSKCGNERYLFSK